MEVLYGKFYWGIIRKKYQHYIDVRGEVLPTPRGANNLEKTVSSEIQRTYNIRKQQTRFRFYFFCGSFMFFLSCVCYAFVRVCLYVCCGHLLGKGWPLGSRLWCLTVSLLLSHCYPGSGVVLDCIDSWSLPPYLLI